MSNEETWSRARASILPITQVIAFFYLFGMLQPSGDDDGGDGGDDDDGDDAMDPAYLYLIIGLICMIPGALIGSCILFKTKTSEPP